VATKGSPKECSTIPSPVNGIEPEYVGIDELYGGCITVRSYVLLFIGVTSPEPNLLISIFDCSILYLCNTTI